MKSPARWALFSALGVEVSACVVGGVLLGLEIDHRAATSPFGVLGGTLLGTAAAFFRLLRYIRLVKRLDEAQSRDERDR